MPLLWILLLAGSLAFNLAVLTISGVYTAASSALSAAGFSTVAAREAGEAATRRQAARKVGRDTARKVTRRVQRGAARNLSSVAGEAIPFVGVAVIVGALALEIDDACDTARDMAGLEAALATTGDPEIAQTEAAEAFDCREIVPGYGDLPDRNDVWRAMRAAPQQAYEAAVQAGLAVADVDWNGYALQTINWLARQMDGLSDYFFAGHDLDQEGQP